MRKRGKLKFENILKKQSLISIISNVQSSAELKSLRKAIIRSISLEGAITKAYSDLLLGLRKNGTLKGGISNLGMFLCSRFCEKLNSFFLLTGLYSFLGFKPNSAQYKRGCSQALLLYRYVIFKFNDFFFCRKKSIFLFLKQF
jgi:hypothetical protein